MDFITKLLKLSNLTTKELYDSIIVIVDKLIKYSILIPFKGLYNTEQLGFILLD